MSFLERHPGFTRRLGYLAVGLCIGCVMLGFFQAAKKREAAQREAAAARQRAEQAGKPDPLFPPVPGKETSAQPAPASTQAK